MDIHTIHKTSHESLRYIIDFINTNDKLDIIANDEGVLQAEFEDSVDFFRKCSLDKILRNKLNSKETKNINDNQQNIHKKIEYHLFDNIKVKDFLDPLAKTKKEKNAQKDCIPIHYIQNKQKNTSPLKEFIESICACGEKVRNKKLESIKNRLAYETNNRTYLETEKTKLESMEKSFYRYISLLQWKIQDNKKNINITKSQDSNTKTLNDILCEFIQDLKQEVENISTSSDNQSAIISAETKNETIKQIDIAYKTMIDLLDKKAKEGDKYPAKEGAKFIISYSLYILSIGIAMPLAPLAGLVLSAGIIKKFFSFYKKIAEYEALKDFIPFAIPVAQAFSYNISYAISICVPRFEGIMIVGDKKFLYFNPEFLYNNLKVQITTAYMIEGRFDDNERKHILDILNANSSHTLSQKQCMQKTQIFAYKGIELIRNIFNDAYHNHLGLCYVEHPLFTSETFAQILVGENEKQQNQSTNYPKNILIISSAPLKLHSGVASYIMQNILHAKILDSDVESQKPKGEDILAKGYRHNSILDYSKYELVEEKPNDSFVLQLSPFLKTTQCQIKMLDNKIATNQTIQGKNEECINKFFRTKNDNRKKTEEFKKETKYILKQYKKIIKSLLNQKEMEIFEIRLLVYMLRLLRGANFCISFEPNGQNSGKLYLARIKQKNKELKLKKRYSIDLSEQLNVKIKHTDESDRNYKICPYILLQIELNRYTQGEYFIDNIIPNNDEQTILHIIHTQESEEEKNIENRLKGFLGQKQQYDDETKRKIGLFWNFLGNIFGNPLKEPLISIIRQDSQKMSQDTIKIFASLFSSPMQKETQENQQKIEDYIEPFLGDFGKNCLKIVNFFAEKIDFNIKKHNFVEKNLPNLIILLTDELLQYLADTFWLTNYEQMIDYYQSLKDKMGGIYNAPYAVKQPLISKNQQEVEIFYPMQVYSNFISFDFCKTFFGGSIRTGGFEICPYILFEKIFDKNCNEQDKIFAIRQLLSYIVIDEKRGVVKKEQINTRNQMSDMEFFANIQSNICADDIQRYKIEGESMLNEYEYYVSQINKECPPIGEYNKAVHILSKMLYQQSEGNEIGQNISNQEKPNSMARNLLDAMKNIGQNNLEGIYKGCKEVKKTIKQIEQGTLQAKNIEQQVALYKRPQIMGRLATTIIISDGLYIG